MLSVVRTIEQAHNPKVAPIGWFICSNPSPATKFESWLNGTFLLRGVFPPMFYAYVIRSSKGRLYTGHTRDMIQRLSEYNSGLCKTTSTDTQWKIIYSEEFPTRGEAMKHEKWLKTGVGRDLIRKTLRGVACAAAE